MTEPILQHRPLAGQRAWLPYLVFGAGLWALLLGIYAIAGSFRAEFSGADEAAYVVSGIMVREYLTGPLWHGVSPVAFAQEYYASYPKVAIGHWPPVYFAVQGIWLLIAGVSREAVLALSALLSTCFALLTVMLCRHEGLRWSMALIAGVVTVLLPIHLGALLEIGSDVITGIAIIVATLCCQRWIDRRTAGNGVLFAVVASIAILCKGNAFTLAFVAPLALLLSTRRLDWFWSRETWRVVAVVIVLVIPWYYFARGWLQDEIVPGPPRSFGAATEYASLLNIRIATSLCGFAMLPLALVSLRTAWYRRLPAIAVLPIATLLFLSLASPHTENRLFLPVVPVVVFAAAIAANSLVPRAQELVLLAALAIAFLGTSVSAKPAVGFVPAVAFLKAVRTPSADRLLVTSNWSGEGALISEFALHQPLPQRTILRASKLFQSSTWMGDNVALHAHSSADVTRILDQNHVTHIVRHVAPQGKPTLYEPGFAEALSRWQLLGTFGEVRIYGRSAVR